MRHLRFLMEMNFILILDKEGKPLLARAMIMRSGIWRHWLLMRL